MTTMKIEIIKLSNGYVVKIEKGNGFMGMVGEPEKLIAKDQADVLDIIKKKMP